MRLTLLLSLLLAAVVQPSAYRQGMILYENGMYGSARTVFESVQGDPLCEGYVVLCALKMRSDDCPVLLSSYRSRYSSSSLSRAISFENALRLFDMGEYSESFTDFEAVGLKAVPPGKEAEYTFKRGYCLYRADRYDEALSEFMKLDSDFSSDYSAPARYLSGLITYGRSEFVTAENWFLKTIKDPRFEDLSRYYVIDCEFNQKHYEYVTEKGSELFPTLSGTRRERLARMLSESYLVTGNNQAAREYYEVSSKKDMARSDYFYAGSVMYGVNDYAEAIDNFLKMTDRSDSLGQIANYHMANSYLRLKNKVAAMNAFGDAAAVEFDPVITEDAYFNYAKLAFDLNKDTSGFTGYMKRWSTGKRGEQIYGYMALAALYDRDYAGAVEIYDRFDELDGDMRLNYAKANYLRAVQLINGGSWRDAVPFLRASAYYIPKYDKFNQLSRYWLAEAFFRTDDYAEARKYFVDLYNASSLQNVPEGQFLSYNVAYCFLNEKDWDFAAKWFDICISSGPESVRKDAMMRRADCDFVSRDYKAAVESYGRLIQEFGIADDIYPAYRQALSYGLSGDSKKKMSVLQSISDVDSGLAFRDDAMYELGRIQMELKHHNDAVATFKKLHSTTENPEFRARALIGLGMVNRNVSNYTKALEYYKEVVSSLPGSEYADDALLSIESIYQKLKEPQKYLEYLEENSLSGDESDREGMYFNTAEKIYLAGNYSQAIAFIDKYMDMFPEGKGKPQLMFYYAESFAALGNKEKACEAYRTAALYASSSFAEKARLNYAGLSYELERYDEALRSYTELSRSAVLEPNRQASCVGMMRSAFKAKDYSVAASSAAVVQEMESCTGSLETETEYILAKSCMALSKREQALSIFRKLSLKPNTPQGAEARYILLQDAFDKGEFESVEKMVYEYSENAGDQSYWLAKSYLLLGDSFLERGNTAQARATFESIRDGYEPQDGSVDDITEGVRSRLEKIDDK